MNYKFRKRMEMNEKQNPFCTKNQKKALDYSCSSREFTFGENVIEIRILPEIEGDYKFPETKDLYCSVSKNSGKMANGRLIDSDSLKNQ